MLVVNTMEQLEQMTPETKALIEWGNSVGSHHIVIDNTPAGSRARFSIHMSFRVPDLNNVPLGVEKWAGWSGRITLGTDKELTPGNYRLDDIFNKGG